MNLIGRSPGGRIVWFVTRSGWGCSAATEAFVAGRPIDPAAGKRELQVHHTGAIDDDDTPNRWIIADAAAYMRRLEVVRPDLGPLPYSLNGAVAEDGGLLLLEGRGSVTRGAHTAGHNVAGIGFGLLGNFDKDDAAAEAADLVSFTLWWLRRQGLPLDRPNPRGWPVWGHRDTANKSCPGNHLYPLLQTVATAGAHTLEDETMLPLKRGDGSPPREYRRSDVASVQGMLNIAGLVLVPGYSKIITDGLYGEATVAAVTAVLGTDGEDVNGNEYAALVRAVVAAEIKRLANPAAEVSRDDVLAWVADAIANG